MTEEEKIQAEMEKAENNISRIFNPMPKQKRIAEEIELMVGGLQ